MSTTEKGPIEEVSWGKFIIRGVEHSIEGTQTKGSGKDIRIIGDRVSEWRERRGHLLQPEMITGIFGQGIDKLIIGTGHDGAIEVTEDTILYIHNNGIAEVIIEKTPIACKKYNEYYVKGHRIALLAHGTC
jgi:hypothetical protein